MSAYLARLAARARGAPASPALKPRLEPRFPAGLDGDVADPFVPAAPARKPAGAPPPPRHQPAGPATQVAPMPEPTSEAEREARVAAERAPIPPAERPETRMIRAVERVVRVEHHGTAVSPATERLSEPPAERPSPRRVPSGRAESPAVGPHPWVRPRPVPARQPVPTRAPEPQHHEPRVEVRIGRVEVQAPAPPAWQPPPVPAAQRQPEANTGFADVAAARRYVDRLP